MTQFFKNLGVVRLVALGGVSLGLIAFFFYIITRLGSPNLTLLYEGVDPTDIGQIAAVLERNNVPYEVRGADIFAAGDRVGVARIQLAEQGLPSSDNNLGYEIFDQQDTLGTTTEVININKVRALEGELAESIASLRDVEAARVHLVLPRRQLFSRERLNPTASVLIRQRGGRQLSKEKLDGIVYLVANAVPELDPSKVTVVDQQRGVLQRGNEDPNSPGTIASNASDATLAYEQRLRTEIESLLEKTVGFNRVRVEVNADLNFDQETETIERYDPDNSVLVSTQTIEENQSVSGGVIDETVTIANNLPNSNQAQVGTGGDSGESQSRTEETTNFNNSRIVTNRVKATGEVERLSVAVLVDGTYVEGEDGPVYQARTPEQLQQLSTLVRTAIGFSEARGDTVEVINMQFAAVDDVGLREPATLFGLSKNDFLQLAEIIVLAVVGLLVILLVVRPVLTRLFESLPTASAMLTSPQGLLREDGSVGMAQAAAIAGPLPEGMDPGSLPDMAMMEAEDDAIESMIDISRVEGRVRASSMRKIGEIIDKHPDESVSIIRNWMYQDQT
ncbi:MAG: flagellar basal-body MS-ring/collar protein FliF [Alphaproteobacteria bacterium]|nr:flagellar basal-body MS-ring/collar protein FliF [Alphaproteobacteria bacterium]